MTKCEMRDYVAILARNLPAAALNEDKAPSTPALSPWIAPVYPGCAFLARVGAASHSLSVAWGEIVQVGKERFKAPSQSVTVQTLQVGEAI